MPTREIPRQQWQSFLDDFSRKHRGEKVVVEVLDREVGPQRAAQDLPLVGISADEKSGENSVAVMVGRKPNDNATHLISDPVHLRVREGEGRPALEIEPRDGPPTLVRFEK